MNKRVVVTGIGAISSIGHGAKDFMHGLLKGESGISKITAFDIKGFPSHNGGQIKNFSGEDYIKNQSIIHLGRASQMSVAAAKLALIDAGFDLDTLLDKDINVIIGTTSGESVSLEFLTEKWLKDGFENINPHAARQTPADRLSRAISKEFGLTGESITISTACAAGNYAMSSAYDAIQTNQSEISICGGCDAMCRNAFAGFTRLGIVAPEKCQPFDKNRQGMIPAEGAGILILESLDHALSRDAEIYAEILGYGITCDAKSMVAQDVDTVSDCIRISHEMAEIKPSDVDYISAHGTGTPYNDFSEYRAVKNVFGDVPPMSSIKSMLGHSMGGASALSGVACCLALKYGFIPPTINYSEPDPEIEIDCVPNVPRKADLKIVQNNAFGMGGNNTVVIMSKWEEKKNDE